MIYRLYLDDLRDPKHSNWTIARSVECAIDLFNVYGLPEKMSLDHDLGDNVPTGYDFVKFLIEKEVDLRNIEINVHSANPIGKNNIIGLIKSWNEFLNSQEKEN